MNPSGVPIEAEQRQRVEAALVSAAEGAPVDLP
jgi:hypothetical protein